VLAVWIPRLALTLPASHTVRHWNLAWIGFDVLLFVGLVSVAWLSRQRSRLLPLPAMATAALLVADAWFDVTTSAPGHDALAAITLALFAELPVAVLCLTIAQRALRSSAKTNEEQRVPTPAPFAAGVARWTQSQERRPGG
jgi:hypothetical protein